MSAPINLSQAIFALSDALDLVGIDEVRHGKRVGCMAFYCGEAMGLDRAACERLFHIGMLHDCGVSSSRVHSRLVQEMEWGHAEVHAIRGARLADSFLPFRGFAQAIRYHHTPWQALLSMDDLEEAARVDANLIFLVDRVDALRASCNGGGFMEDAEIIKARVQGYSGTLFSPALVEVFLWAARAEAFWMTLEAPHLDRFLTDMDRSIPPRFVPFEEVKHLARLFSEIVDVKSPFTYQHSIGVAQLARHLGHRLGLADATLDKIEVAGLLHDLGKLRVPDEILEKPGKLDPRDLQVMSRHSFESYDILRGIGGFEEIALWAAHHHETPAGDGYPFHREGQQLGIEARIIAVADVFQALAQDRPYRNALPLDQIIGILNDMARQGRLDAGCVALVTAEPEVCMDWATKART
jgi:putative nucleotidyltransferase with HDIG domain